MEKKKIKKTSKRKIQKKSIKDKAEFNPNKVYSRIISKKELLQLIKRTYDEEFVLIFLPRDKYEADFVIRSVK